MMMRRAHGSAAWLLSSFLALIAFANPVAAQGAALCERPTSRLAQVICPDGELRALHGLVLSAERFDRESPRTMESAVVAQEAESAHDLMLQLCDLAGFRPVQPPQRARLSRCAHRQLSARLSTLSARLPDAAEPVQLPPSMQDLVGEAGGAYALVDQHRNSRVFIASAADLPPVPTHVRRQGQQISGDGFACAFMAESQLTLPLSRALPLLSHAGGAAFASLTLDPETPLEVRIPACQLGALPSTGAYALSPDGTQLYLYNGSHLLVFAR